jgi:hypothetical protein
MPIDADLPEAWVGGDVTSGACEAGRHTGQASRGKHSLPQH